MRSNLRQQILKELKKVIKEQEYYGVSQRRDIVSQGIKADPGIQKLVGGQGSPQDILNYVKSQVDSYNINDDEARLMYDSVVSANKKCTNQQLSQEDYNWCTDFKKVAGTISQIVSTGTKGTLGRNTWNPGQGSTQEKYKQSMIGSLNNIMSLNLVAPAQPATPAEGTPPAAGTGATPSATPDQQPTTAAGVFDARTRSFKCPQPNIIANFQNWVKTNAQTPQAKAIKADGAFGPRTFAAAKSLGNAVLNFSMYNSIDDFKDQTKLNQICSTIAGDSRFRAAPAQPAAQPAAPAPAQPAAQPVANPPTKAPKRDSFYEVKKQKEAQKLFERLIKSVIK